MADSWFQSENAAIELATSGHVGQPPSKTQEGAAAKALAVSLQTAAVTVVTRWYTGAAFDG